MSKRRASVLSCLAIVTVVVAGVPAGAQPSSTGPEAEEAWNVEYLGYQATPDRALGVAVAGDYAYVADYDTGLRIIEVSNPYAPVEAGFYLTEEAALSVVVATGESVYAYVGEHYGVRILDVTDPGAPFETGHCDTPDYASDVELAGTYLYAANRGAGLVILDVSNPYAPFVAGTFDTAGEARSVAKSGEYAYVADGPGGLVILDVSDPEAVFEAGQVDIPGYAEGVEVAGATAYVTAGGVRVIDVSDPYDAFETGFCHPLAMDGQAVAVEGGYAYVGDMSRGLRVFDVSDPYAPFAAGSWGGEPASQGHDVVVAGGTVYLTGLMEGLFVLGFVEPPSTAFVQATRLVVLEPQNGVTPLMGLVRVVDETSAPVAGATVDLALWYVPHPLYTARLESRVTNANGLALLWLPVQLPGTYGLCAIGVRAEGYGYDHHQNVERCDTGTVP